MIMRGKISNPGVLKNVLCLNVPDNTCRGDGTADTDGAARSDELARFFFSDGKSSNDFPRPGRGGRERQAFTD